MRELPILFSAPMVRAILEGRKTMTRRILNPQPVWCPEWGTAIGMNGEWVIGSPAGLGLSNRGDNWHSVFDAEHRRRYATSEAYGWGARAGCPYGQPGDRLWVRETFAKVISQSGDWIETDYRATYSHGERLGDSLGIKRKWKSPIHMPRTASRITLEVTDVRVERLQDISEADARSEGVGAAPDFRHAMNHPEAMSFRVGFAELWEQLHGAGSWDANPWIWVVSFRRIEVVLHGSDQ